MGLNSIFMGQPASCGQVYAPSRALLACALPLLGQHTTAIRRTCKQTASPLSRQPDPSIEECQALQAQTETRQ